MKKLCWLIPLMLVVFGLLLFPHLASTPWGKSIVTRAMEQRTHLHLSLDTLSLSWFGPQKLQGIVLSSPEVVGRIDTLESNVPLWALSDANRSFSLQNGSFSFPAYNGGQIEQVNVRIEGSEIQATGTTTLGGHLSLKGKIYSEEDFEATFDGASIPVGVLEEWFHTKGLFRAALGPTFDLKGSWVNNRKEGTLACDLSSPLAQATLSGALFENVLTLTEPFLATFHLTKELGENLLRHSNPQFLTAIEGKNPVIVRVATKNFSLPLDHWRQLRIGNATLDIGKVRIQGGSSLQSLLTLLHSPRTQGPLDLWFTPVTFQVDEGVIQQGRMDALLEGVIHLCSWGQIDWGRDQLHLFLGLPADTLAYSFGLKKLPPHYVIKVPIRGSLRNPEFETGAASSKIAAMIAAEKAPKIGGTGGKVFGGLMNLFSQVQAKEDEDVPPPNLPFPWDR